MYENFLMRGKASFTLGGQWGSCGKGAAVAFMTKTLCEQGEFFDIVTTNNGVQSGHTSVHNGVTRVAFHLPTAPLIARHYGFSPIIYLNGGAIVHPETLEQELRDLGGASQLHIHPNAAIVTEACQLAERQNTSAQTKIASTRKGVGEALARKVLRSGVIAKDHPFTKKFVNRLDLNAIMSLGKSVLVEIPQGIGLSLDSQFYPFCTSRNCTVGQAMADAGIHPDFYGASLLVLRTFPIRVGAIVEAGAELGTSGGRYPDQREVSWNELRQKPEITTVTKRVRRVFSFSVEQMREAMTLTRPTHIHLTFCDYQDEEANAKLKNDIMNAALDLGLTPPRLLCHYGPSTADVK